MVNKYSVKSYSDAYEALQKISTQAADLGFVRPDLTSDSDQKEYKKIGDSQVYFRVETTKRGERKIKAERAVTEDLMKLLSDTSKPLHYMLHDRYKVKYIYDINKFDRSVVENYYTVICCFDDSVIYVVLRPKQIIYEIVSTQSETKVISANARDIKNKIQNHLPRTYFDPSGGGGDTLIELIPINFITGYKNLFSYFVLSCLLFDVNDCSSNKLDKLKTVCLTNKLIFEDFSKCFWQNPSDSVNVSEEKGVADLRQTYLVDQGGTKIPMKKWFDGVDESKWILDTETSYWTRINPGIVQGDRAGDKHTMSFQLHKLSDHTFCLEPVWSPYRKVSKGGAGATIGVVVDRNKPKPKPQIERFMDVHKANKEEDDNRNRDADEADKGAADPNLTHAAQTPSEEDGDELEKASNAINTPEQYDAVTPGSVTSGSVTPGAASVTPGAASVTPGSVTPGTGSASVTPGKSTPGSVTPGSVTFGSVTPGSVTPGSVTFGSVTPGSVTPGSVTFGSVTPGSVTFGSVTPGSVTFGSVTPGSVTPGSVTPGSVTFGSVTPGSVTFGSVTPGSVTFGSVTPGSVTFGSVTPGSVTFGSVTPGSVTPRTGSASVTPGSAATATGPTAMTKWSVLRPPKPLPKARRFLNRYYECNHLGGEKDVYCGEWTPIKKSEEFKKYKENDRCIFLDEKKEKEWIYDSAKKNLQPHDAVPPTDQDELIKEPTVPFPREQPKSSGQLTVFCGVLFKEKNWKWEIQSNPTWRVPDYVAVMTPLGARFFKESDYDTT